MTRLAPAALRMVPHGGDDGEEIGAGRAPAAAILRRDAADGDRWHRHHLAPPAHDLGVGLELAAALGRARIEAAEGDIIGAGLGRLDGEIAAAVAGDADDAVRTQKAPRLGIGRVFLADMDAVAAGREREVGPVVHDEGDVARLRDRAQQHRPRGGSCRRRRP